MFYKYGQPTHIQAHSLSLNTGGKPVHEIDQLFGDGARDSSSEEEMLHGGNSDSYKSGQDIKKKFAKSGDHKRKSDADEDEVRIYIYIYI